jgi:hypothetical protein
MAEATTTVGECRVPLVRLGVLLIIALVGFFIAVMGFVMDNATLIVIGTMSVALARPRSTDWQTRLTDGVSLEIDRRDPVDP